MTEAGVPKVFAFLSSRNLASNKTLSRTLQNSWGWWGEVGCMMSLSGGPAGSIFTPQQPLGTPGTASYGKSSVDTTHLM